MNSASWPTVKGRRSWEASLESTLGAAEVPTGVRVEPKCWPFSPHPPFQPHLQSPGVCVPTAFSHQSRSHWVSIQPEVLNPSEFPVRRERCVAK